MEEIERMPMPLFSGSDEIDRSLGGRVSGVPSCQIIWKAATRIA